MGGATTVQRDSTLCFHRVCPTCPRKERVKTLHHNQSITRTIIIRRRRIAKTNPVSPLNHHATLTPTSNHMTPIRSPQETKPQTQRAQAGSCDPPTLRHHYKRTSCDREKDAYSIPHPVPPKITPKARMVPATAPISLLAATLAAQKEKGHSANRVGTSRHKH